MSLLFDLQVSLQDSQYVGVKSSPPVRAFLVFQKLLGLWLWDFSDFQYFSINCFVKIWTSKQMWIIFYCNVVRGYSFYPLQTKMTQNIPIIMLKQTYSYRMDTETCKKVKSNETKTKANFSRSVKNVTWCSMFLDFSKAFKLLSICTKFQVNSISLS